MQERNNSLYEAIANLYRKFIRFRRPLKERIFTVHILDGKFV